MRYLLLAPSRVTSGGDVSSEAPSRGDAKPTLRSRHDFDAYELRQVWDDLPIGQHLTNDDLPLGCRVDKAAVCWIRNSAVLAIEVTVPGSSQGDELARLEGGLTAAAAEYAQAYLQDPYHDLAWVGRTVLQDEGVDTHEEWVAPQAREVTLSGADRTREAVLVASWGNGSIQGDRHLDDEAWKQTVRGMADAQALWRDISAIAETAAGHARSRLGRGRRSRSEMKRFLDDIEVLTWAIAQHNLAFDELKLVVQGNRKAAGLAWLYAWGYVEMVDRVERRLQDLESVAQRRAERLNAKYQGSIEVILLSLGALALFEVAFSAISAAYSGGVQEVPGGWGVLSVIRIVHGDPLVVLSAGVLLVGILWLWRARKATL